eukprot:6528698-Alexandrium_andersonii.AAC.1
MSWASAGGGTCPKRAKSSCESIGSRGMRNLLCALVWLRGARAVSVFAIALAAWKHFGCSILSPCQ